MFCLTSILIIYRSKLSTFTFFHSQKVRPLLHPQIYMQTTLWILEKRKFMIMEKEEEIRIQHLGFYGIFMESFTITFFSHSKLLSQITISTIFPLSLIFLCHVQFSEFMETLISSEKLVFWLIKIVFFILFIALSLLSTCAVVYTVACNYTRKEITFVEVMSEVPKVWKRITVTLIWSFILLLVYNVIAFSIVLPWLGSIYNRSNTQLVISGSLFAIYMTGFVYISIIWHLASVVSILEENCGIEAMIKGKAVAKGTMAISFSIFLLINSCFILIQMVFQRFVVHGESFWSRIGYGILCFFLLSGFTLLGLIVQTLVYLVCKLNHREIIDEPCLLANDLDVYFGDYAPLRSTDGRSTRAYLM